MTWARLDDQAWKNERLLALGVHARLLFLVTLSFIGEGWPENDGVVGDHQAAAIARIHGVRKSAIAELVDLKRWEIVDGGFHVHDIERYMPPKDLSTKRSQAGMRGAAKTNSNRSANAAANSRQTVGKGSATVSANGRQRDPVPVPVIKSPTETPAAPLAAHANGASNGALNGTSKRATLAAQSAAVQRVWDAWLESAGGGRSVLDLKRRRAIAAAIESHGIEDAVDAVRGWTHDPWPDRPKYNDVTVLLRDAGHIEKFRDLHRRSDSAVHITTSEELHRAR